MAPTDTKTTDLLPLAERWRLRETLTGAALLKRAARAAELELRGKDLREDRADAAGRILTDSLADLPGAPRAERMRRVMPRRVSKLTPYQRAVIASQLGESLPVLPTASDERFSLNAYALRAKNERVRVQRQRQRDERDAERASDDYALSMDALAPDEQREAEQREAESARLNAPDPADAYRRAQEVAAALGRADAATVGLIYQAARAAHGLTSADAVGELRALAPDVAPRTAAALRKRSERAAALIAGDWSAGALIAAVTADAPQANRWRWSTAAGFRTLASPTRVPVLLRGESLGLIDWSGADLSRGAYEHGKSPGGRQYRRHVNEPNVPTYVRPTTADAARAVCKLSSARGRRKARPLTAAEHTEHRSALLAAERAARGR